MTKEEKVRLDPLINGFNPTEMYAADHIRRALQTFPGVFTGIGEFTMPKEFVSAKIPGAPTDTTSETGVLAGPAMQTAVLQ